MVDRRVGRGVEPFPRPDIVGNVLRRTDAPEPRESFRIRKRGDESMSIRVIQVTVPGDESVDELFSDRTIVGVWPAGRRADCRIVQLALRAEDTEELIDELETRFGNREEFQLLLLEAEAVVPRMEEDEEEEGDEAGVDGEEDEAKDASSSSRISREELYADLTDGLDLSRVYLVMVALSAVVAGLGLLRDDLAVVIGAMVIAPLLQPNVALALSATLGDLKLAVRAGKAAAGGVAVAFGLSIALGAVLSVDPSVPALASRTSFDLVDLVLALAAGTAGSLAFTRGLAGPVIGVMVAVALLPPLVACGVLLGAGEFSAARGAGLLTAANVICINLAGVATFLAQRVRPRTWWEAKRARRATWIAVIVWSLLLAGLVGAILLSGDTFAP